MPYAKTSELPDAVKGLPAHAKEIYMSAFNAAFTEYKDRGDQREALAHQTAWAAVKSKYKKEGDRWVAKEAVHPHGEHVCVCSECGEEITVEANVKCNSQKCPKCGGPMVAKTAGEQRESNVIAQNVDVIEVICPVCGGDRFIEEGKYLKCCKCGELVESQKPTGDTLQSKYATLIQEYGRRNATKDAARIHKIMELLKELLDDDEEMLDAEKAKAAIKEADAVLELLKLQEVVKTEDGQEFPMSAFAYTPDPEKPSEWKLRLWEDPRQRVTRKQRGAAAAALSPGGFRGQRVDIPQEDLAAVKRKIRGEYRKLDVEDEDIPRWVKESESRNLLYNYTPLTEANIGTKGVAKIVVIKPGFGNPVDNHYYPAETLSRDYLVFEGAKMYSDHQTEEEEKSRPEGSIRQWVASLKNVHFEEGIGIVGDAVIIEPWLQAKLATLRDQKLLSEMGISIRAAGTGTKGTIDGKEANIVERITRVRSVDFVTEAGAGGTVLLYEVDKEFDIDIISLGALKERRPDLVKSISNEVKQETLKEVKKAMELEEKVTELEKQVESLTTERDELKTKMSEAEKAQRIAEAKSMIDEAISKAELPEAAKARLVERFKDAETADGVVEAIKAETDYVNALKESAKPKNLGASVPDAATSRKELKEAFMRAGMDEKSAEIAANAR